MKRKRVIVFVATVMLSICSLLSGCESKDGKKEAESMGVRSEADEVNEGHYLETSEELPYDQKQEELVAVAKHTTSNQLHLFTRDSKMQYKEYSKQENGEWNDSAASWLNEIIGGMEVWIIDMTYDTDGNLYALYCDASNQCIVLRTEDGSKVDSFSVGNRAAGGIAADQEGNFILPYDEEAVVYNSAGKEVRRLQEGTAPSQINQGFDTYEGKFVTKNLNNNGIVIYDVATGNIEKEAPYDFKEGEDINIKFDSKGCVYIGDTRGIHYMSPDSKEFITIVEGQNNAMSYFTISKICTLDINTIYVVYTDFNTSETTLYKYTYEDGITNENIDIYALHVTDTLQKAVIEFKKKYPTINVTIKEATKDGTATIQDNIRMLNTELLNGTGADILVLDGLPVDSYIEKGILEDMSDIVDTSSLLPNVVANMQKDHEIYAVPTYFGLPIAMGDKEAIQKMQSLDGFIELANTGKVPFSSMHKDSFIEMCTVLYYNALIGKNGAINKTQLQSYLKALQTYSKEIELTELTPEEAAFNKEVDYGNTYMPMIRWNDDLIYAWADGKSDMGIAELSGIDSMIFPSGIANGMNVDLQSFGNIYFPYCTIGVNHNSSHIDRAKEFVAVMLSEEVQSENTSDGFPVNVAALEALKKFKNDNKGGSIILSNGTEINIQNAPKEQIAIVVDACKKASSPVEIEQIVKDMIIEESECMLAGTITPGQAAINIESKVNMYLSE